MPQQSKGARLWLRPATERNASIWIIRDDGGYWKSTGLGPLNSEAAEERLAAYIISKRPVPRISGRHPSQVQVADVLVIYSTDVGGRIARPEELGQRVEALLSFWGTKTLADVNAASCGAYAGQRGAMQMARKELEDLRAAINHHRRAGLCSEVVEVTLPEKSAPRERWLTRSEAARLLWSAWRGGQGKRKHVARFILVGLYTGTRAGAICASAPRRTVGRGYVDLTEGVFYRRAPGSKQTKKRQPPLHLDGRILAHLRRWARLGISSKSVIEHGAMSDAKRDELKARGKKPRAPQPIGRMAKAFRNAAREAGLPDVHPHVLRHTAVTWAMQGGADLYEAADAFGMTYETLETTYGHHNPEHHRSVMRAIRARR